MSVIVCEIVFGVLASVIVAWFSRQREYRADAGSANLMGSREPMIRALARLGGLEPGELPKAFKASGISCTRSISALDPKSGGLGQSVSVRVDPGGRSVLQK